MSSHATSAQNHQRLEHASRLHCKRRKQWSLCEVLPGRGHGAARLDIDLPLRTPDIVGFGIQYLVGDATRPHDVYNFLTFECVRLAAKATKLISGIGRPCVRQFSSSAGHTYLACRLMVRSRTASPLCLGTETNRLWPGRRPRRVSGPTVRRVASSSMLDSRVVRKGGSRREHLSLLLLSALRRQPFDEAAGRRGQWGGEVGVLRPLLFTRGNRARRYPARRTRSAKAAGHGRRRQAGQAGLKAVMVQLPSGRPVPFGPAALERNLTDVQDGVERRGWHSYAYHKFVVCDFNHPDP